MSVPSVTIEQLDGLSENPAEQARLHEWGQVSHESQRADIGESHAWDISEVREWLTNPLKRVILLAAIEDGRVVGAADLHLSLRDNTHLVIFNLHVLPDRRRRGIGSLLLKEAERLAREHGRRTLITETAWAGESPDDDFSGAFARVHGYTDVQTMRRSDQLICDASTDMPVPQGYAIETHVGIPPAQDAGDRAWLQRRMSTDAPLGGLDMEEQDWDAQRILAMDARIERMGRSRVSSYARHLQTGRLVGFTDLQISAARQDLGYQGDTLVLVEHRGHRLGLALKAANIARARTAYPQLERVRTWNALENTHMLAVNEALGYVSQGLEREWQKQL